MTRNIDQRINASRAMYQNPYAHLAGSGEYEAVLPAHKRVTPMISVAQVMKGHRKGRARSKADIEAIARNLHKLMWLSREKLFGTTGVEPVEIVDPVLALKALGYGVSMHDSLGLHAAGKDTYEVAGIMDRDVSEVRISLRFRSAMRHFTAAHELGHALMHNGSGLHRDRAPDGSSVGIRDPQEAEADAFASYFLLPDKIVRAAFVTRFLTPRFELNDATAFALSSQRLTQVKLKFRSERDLSRMLAGARHYNGLYFQSLADKFQVSVEVMAIRLEELGLVAAF